MDAALERARTLRLMAFDVDGGLTDGALYLTDGGEEMKSFHTLDGLGLKLLAGAGVELALITGRSSRVVAKRAAELGITRLFQGADDKLAVFEGLRAQLGLPLSACGYMGDDLQDLPVLRRAGFSARCCRRLARKSRNWTGRARGQGCALWRRCPWPSRSPRR